MNWRRTKNLILLMLLITNVFLFVNYAVRVNARQEIREEAANNTYEYLASQNIYIDKKLLLVEGNNRSRLIVERDMSGEEELLRALTNSDSSEDRGGAVVASSGEYGEAAWRNAGLIDAKFEKHGLYGNGDGKAMKEFLTEAGFGVTGCKVITDELGYVFSAVSNFMGQPVFNCMITVRCETNDKCTLSGRWCVGEPVSSNTEREVEIAGIIVNYVRYMQGVGIQINSIDSLEPGYIAQQAQSMGMVLVPVWKIVSGGHVSYMSALNATLVLSETAG